MQVFQYRLVVTIDHVGLTHANSLASYVTRSFYGIGTVSYQRKIRADTSALLLIDLIAVGGGRCELADYN